MKIDFDLTNIIAGILLAIAISPAFWRGFLSAWRSHGYVYRKEHTPPLTIIHHNPNGNSFPQIIPESWTIWIRDRKGRKIPYNVTRETFDKAKIGDLFTGKK